MNDISKTIATAALGIGCEPVIGKGQEEQFLEWLRGGVESEAVRFPASPGSIHCPSLGLKDIFLPANQADLTRA